MKYAHPSKSEEPPLGWIRKEEGPRVRALAQAAMKADPVSLRSVPLPTSAEAAGALPGDFYSMGDYWWPDPTTPHGLPYIRRDGESNPENFDTHRLLLREMRDQVAALAAGYVLDRNPKVAQRASAWLRVFFVDPATRMHPHLRFAQAIPGVTPGRGIGIIDTLHLIEVLPALEAMANAPGIDGETITAVRAWFAEYLQWMLTHPNGIEEGATPNNHSVAYWLQVAVFARSVRHETALVEARRQWSDVILPDQMAPDGSFPRELERTKSYGYSIFQLDNVALLTEVLSGPDDELWAFRLPDGRSIARAIAYLYPFLHDKEQWPFPPDVAHFEAWPVRGASLLLGGLRLAQPDYLALWRRLEPDPRDLEVQRNVAMTQPLLWLRSGD